ncbi:hypothetical protein [Streptomyces sp. NPDC053431]|uniref:hypothetical protein n=1 Tax=Streptomyces sp. NPDC053431 TaxID=3365703 RepID=UPI0037D1D80E
MMGTEEVLRLTIAALMAQAGERQSDLAAGLGQSQAQVSRKQGGRSHWSLEDVDLLAAHYEMHVLDLLAGPTHAAGVLHGSIASLQSTGAQLPPALTSTPAPAVTVALDQATAVTDGLERERPGFAAGLVRSSRNSAVDGQPSAPVVVPSVRPSAAPVQPCVLCGQPTQEELEGFPQHLTAEGCAEATAAAHPPFTAASAPAAEEAQTSVPAVSVDPPAVVETPVAPAVPTEPAVPAPAAPRRSVPGYASGSLVEQITDRV